LVDFVLYNGCLYNSEKYNMVGFTKTTWMKKHPHISVWRKRRRKKKFKLESSAHYKYRSQHIYNVSMVVTTLLLVDAIHYLLIRECPSAWSLLERDD
jgi:hypothetical protein